MFLMMVFVGYIVVLLIMMVLVVMLSRGVVLSMVKLVVMVMC